MRRVSEAAGVPPNAGRPPPALIHHERTLHWVVDALDLLGKRITELIADPAVPSTTPPVPTQQRTQANPALPCNMDIEDGLDGLGDFKVDSEDDVSVPHIDSHLLSPLSTAQSSRLPANAGSSSTDAPALNLTSLPALQLGDDGQLHSGNSSHVGIARRPPSSLPIGSDANLCLTENSSWRSVGHGDPRKLHADYTQIFGTEADTPIVSGESTMSVAAGEMYNPKQLSERWALGTLIGEGGYSKVYIAENKAMSAGCANVEIGRDFPKLAAVKVIPKKSNDYNEKMVSREVFSVRLLQMAGGHSNIVEMYEVYEDDDYVYLVMELLAGGELFASITERGRYTERDAASLALSMLAALACCHRLNLTHRDVKPENFVFLTRDGNAADLKLTDFGISHYSEDPSALCKTLCGTPLYVAPEVVLRQPYGPEADIWSLGVIVYVMLVGYPPFDDLDIVELMKKIKFQPVKFDGEGWDLISNEGKHFVAHLLDKDASNRMTAQQAMEHDWLRNNCEAAPPNTLQEAQGKIKEFVSRHLWRTAIQGVRAVNRIQKMVEMSRENTDYGISEFVAAQNDDIVERVTTMDEQDEESILRRYSSSSSSEQDLQQLGLERRPPVRTSPPPKALVPSKLLRYSSLHRKRSSSVIVHGSARQVKPNHEASMVLLPIDPAFESSGELHSRTSSKREDRPKTSRVTYSSFTSRMESSSPRFGNSSIGTGTSNSSEGMENGETKHGRDQRGVVRKMSSHAKKLVGRGRRAVGGVVNERERPPVMLSMGDQRNRRKFGKWFKN